MNWQQINQALQSGETVVDIGQISKRDRARLNLAAKRGRIVKGQSFRFPIPKNAYWVPALQPTH